MLSVHPDIELNVDNVHLLTTLTLLITRAGQGLELFHALAHRNFPKTDARECEHKVGQTGTTETIWGTSSFMALGLLENTSVVHTAKHDLESFFWVLLWCVLRYTPHRDPSGALACDNIFGGYATGKSLIFYRDFPSHIPEGTRSALYDLGDWMKQMVSVQNPPSAPGLKQDTPAYHAVFADLTSPCGYSPKDMNYSDLQKLFAIALAQTDDWPENDAAIPFHQLEVCLRSRDGPIIPDSWLSWHAWI
ncbi:hypothetical protein MIND_00168700 [Mycena indigotica]|uniref:Fungal-type protein kinase domain-containing protein n=1 Tax=Mycena indigotica TaxID=2126181 RepID=A0A8H6TGY4_9AGAR|nr:uncharacterized protein MIND_00168700 [Mycena indigotica]KAF7316496.1 hypothetical protein MIND_00168700 [Mycena indigotica]